MFFFFFFLLQFRYKRRVYTQTYLDEKQLSKLHTKVSLSSAWWLHITSVADIFKSVLYTIQEVF